MSAAAMAWAWWLPDGVPPEQRLLLLALADAAGPGPSGDDVDECWLKEDSMPRLAAKCGMTVQQVFDTITDLVINELLIPWNATVAFDNDGRYVGERTWTYRFPGLTAPQYPEVQR